MKKSGVTYLAALLGCTIFASASLDPGDTITRSPGAN